jgi:uncharacterized membrane protein YeaQ/YmgE (transglycosylase-associated protein family)
MWIISFILLGLVAGAIARLLHPGRDPMNWLWTMLLGMGGALLGGFVGGMLGFNTDEGLMRWLSAIAGAVVLLVLYHMITARRTSAPAGPGPLPGPATNDDYKKAVFRDLSRGPNG